MTRVTLPRRPPVRQLLTGARRVGRAALRGRPLLFGPNCEALHSAPRATGLGWTGRRAAAREGGYYGVHLRHPDRDPGRVGHRHRHGPAAEAGHLAPGTSPRRCTPTA